MMNDVFERARGLLSGWKGGRYVFGRGALSRLGGLAAGLYPGARALVVGNSGRGRSVVEDAAASLRAAGLSVTAVVPGARPNAPQADMYRVETCVLRTRPDLVVAVGGGSTIDACKAACFLAALGAEKPDIESWFGTGRVTETLRRYQLAESFLPPLLAVQTAASSAAHLTKYANITDPAAGQKKLVVDEAITPPAALFDYDVTVSQPAAVTIDGALDALAHCVEVFTGLPREVSREKYDLVAAMTACALELVLRYAPAALSDPGDREAREGLGLASDLGGYAIMVGGTHGPHLTSFSLVGLAGHGTACGVMNPYFLVLFAPAIADRLPLLGTALKGHGFFTGDPEGLPGRELALGCARGLAAFNRSIGAPATLRELPGWDPGAEEAVVDRIIRAVRDPALEMKLRNMPAPLSAATVEARLTPVLRAAITGDFSLIDPVSSII